MILSFGIGSAGVGSPSYSVRLPFQMSPGRILKLSDGNSFELFSQPCEITEEHRFYVLTIGGFSSEKAAGGFLRKACAGLIWFGLRHAVGFRFNINAVPVIQVEPPQPIADGSMIASIAANVGWREIDGHYDADKTVIKAEHKRLIKFGAGQASVRLDSPVSMLAKDMPEGMGAQAELVLSDPKLRLACEVYLSSHFESSSAASFLSRIMALEILIPDTPALASISRMAERFTAEVVAVQEQEQDGAIKAEWESFKGLLSWARYRSIKSRIRTLVREKLESDPDIADPAEVSKEVSRLYDLRSTLVHRGEADPNAIRDGAGRLNNIVPRILRACFREVSGVKSA